MSGSVAWHAVIFTTCAAAVFFGMIPVLAGVYQYLLLPIESLKNHWKRSAPYLPRVAVLVPAWNEGAVLAASLERFMNLEYPPDRLRAYVVDDASTDDTPQVVLAKAAEYSGRIFHLRREQGGQGKAHTLNHGLAILLQDDWMESVLITDADVIFRPDSLRRLTRHLADPAVGAATAYIREGSYRPGAVARFVGYEYITAQAAARRAQNVLGVVACLAGGAQIHSRANLEAVGGRIDTTTLAEDTFTTFLTQLAGRKVVFDATAIVLAEEPSSVASLWKQRLRWARGNVQITSHFRRLWFRPRRGHRLGSLSFGLIWFSVYLLPVAMALATLGLLALHLVDPVSAERLFRWFWWVASGAYLYVTLTSLLIDPATARRTWFEGLTFPGLGAIAVMAAVWFPGFWEATLPGWFGLALTPLGQELWLLSLYCWPLISMVLSYLLRWVDTVPRLRWLASLLLYGVGYGPLLCAITIDAYVKELRKASVQWDKTEKTGRVMG